VIVKRSLSLDGHRTSLALEPEFWQAVDRLAAAGGRTTADFISGIDRDRDGRNLASAVRVAVLKAAEAAGAIGAAATS